MIVNMDYFTREGAGKLKRTIDRYWNARGLFPIVKVIEQPGIKDGRRIYVVRSNLTFDKTGYPYVRKETLVT